jgi:hypothetical protein
MILSVTIAGVPPKKNRRHVLVGGAKPRLINSGTFKGFAKDLRAAWDAADLPEIRSGVWQLEVHCVWPRQRHLDISFPLGDVDAPISSILDAAQICGILDDDVRVLKVSASKDYAKGSPSTRVTFTQLVSPPASTTRTKRSSKSR